MENSFKQKIVRFTDEIYDLCSAETCFHKVKDEWTENNKFFGHCAVVSLLIQDKFGGDIYRVDIPEKQVSHYFNKIGNEEIDVTKIQYAGEKITPENKRKVSRQTILNIQQTADRYEKLKEKYEEKKRADKSDAPAIPFNK